MRGDAGIEAEAGPEAGPRPGTETDTGARRSAALPILLLCAAGVLAYHNSLEGPFFFDDLTSIPDNPHIREICPPWRFLSMPSDLTISGRPVVALSLAANYALGGLRVTGYHLFNLLIHVAAALLLFGVLRRTVERCRPGLGFEGSSDRMALAVALLWLVHPLNTEAVNYVVQRTELLMGLFYLLTLYAFIRSTGRDAAPGTRRGWSAIAVLSCALGMASKEVMVTCPLMVLVYDRIFVAGSFRRALRSRALLHAGLVLTWGVLIALVTQLPRARSTGFGLAEFGAWDYLQAQLSVILVYLKLALWPHPLLVDHGDWTMAGPLTAAALPAAVALVLMAAATVIALTRRPAAGFLGVWFFGVLAPTSSFVPILTEVAAERRMYLPLAAVMVLIVLAGYQTLGSLRRQLRLAGPRAALIGALLVGALAGVYCLLTLERNRDYRSEVSIWRDTVTKNPDNPRAQENLGVSLLNQGDPHGAMIHLRRSLALRPGSATAQDAMGGALAKTGDPERAREHLATALKLDPRYPNAHNNMGNLLAQQGKLQEAITFFERAIRLKPHFGAARFNLAKALTLRGRTSEAAAQLEQAIALQPERVQFLHALASLRVRQGQLEQALGLYRRAMQLRGDDPVLLHDFGVTLARAGQLEAAVATLKAALRARPDYRSAHRNLGIALMRLGRAEEARYHFSRAKGPR
jgi:Flp pilus assembly protein TadD